MNKNNNADPISEGFRNPPDNITDPCLVYMARVMDLRKFIAFVFGYIKTSAELAKLIPEDQHKQLHEGTFKLLRYSYSEHRQLVNEIMLSRAVESFDLYLTTILRDIFIARPEMLKSEATVDISTIIDAGNYENLIWQIVDRKVHDLSYKSLSDLRKFITSRTNIDIFSSESMFEIVLIASEIRNLIAHNDCVINDQFKSKIGTTKIPLDVTSTGKIKIDDEWLRRASYTLDGIVFRFDELASKKFDLLTRFRSGAFLLRD
ncbi:MAG: hypothetical protein ACK4GK_00040 [Ferrovibrio sp.]